MPSFWLQGYFICYLFLLWHARSHELVWNNLVSMIGGIFVNDKRRKDHIDFGFNSSLPDLHFCLQFHFITASLVIIATISQSRNKNNNNNKNNVIFYVFYSRISSRVMRRKSVTRDGCACCLQLNYSCIIACTVF